MHTILTKCCLGAFLRFSKPSQQRPQENSDFDVAVTPSLLSNLLIWYIFWDVVQVPDDPQTWYDSSVSQESMHSFIGLGHLLRLESRRHKIEYPRNLLSCCQALGLDVHDVRKRLIRIGSREEMAASEIADIPLGDYKAYAKKLQWDKELTLKLRPDSGSRFLVFRHQILDRIEEYDHFIIRPQLDRTGYRLPSPVNSEEWQDRTNIRNAFRALHDPRPVEPPLEIYSHTYQTATVANNGYSLLADVEDEDEGYTAQDQL
ncbi:hypothetical protein EJ08DRAFT_703450 [Tothia fuscella]|uniref:Uncharacterized protein n=1 Tax=Tothia fuscella TaxID=1048955 RepID=A0A9P4NEB2_9PEZI|nr:hypothetical protein EJ08DRAFT_703450 [Tothia fuscella]